MANYLLAGAAGFIGAAVAGRLLDAGHAVLGVDDLNDAYDVRLKQWRLERLRARERFTFRRADVRDRTGLEAACADAAAVDGVLNLAARAGVRASVDDPWAYVDANVTGTLNLLDLGRARGVRKFVQASTSQASTIRARRCRTARTRTPAGPGARTPPPSRRPRPCATPTTTSSGSTSRSCATSPSTVRRGRPDMSPFRFVQWVSEGRPVRLYGDGSQSRDFTYVDDAARGTVAGLAPLGYEVVNLGAGVPVPLLEVLRFVEAGVGRPARVERLPPHAADASATWADISKAKRLLGWEPRIAWKEGVKRLADWYAANRAWARELRTVD